MGREEAVDMGQQGTHARGARLEALEAKKRVQPDQLAAGALKPRGLAGEKLRIAALETVRDQKDDRPLPQHPARPVAVYATKRLAAPFAALPIPYRDISQRTIHCK